MSTQAMGWVLDESESVGSDRLVLLSIANHTNKDTRECFLTLDTIAKEARVSRSTVQRCIKNLTDLGELEIVRGGGRGRATDYRMTFIKQCQIDTLFPSGEDNKRCQIEQEKVSNTTLKGVTGDHPTVLTNNNLLRKEQPANAGLVAKEIVSWYVDEYRKATKGREPIGRWRGACGREAKKLLEAGRTEHEIKTVLRYAINNAKNPGLLVSLMAEYDLERAG